MQVNQLMPISLAVLQGVTSGEQPADQVTAVGQAVPIAPNMEVVAQTFARLEQTLLQWFFTQRPELGDALAQLLSLREQLSSENDGGMANSSTNTTNTTNTTNPSTTNTNTNTPNFANLDGKLVKILDMMKMLLISPREQPAVKSDVIQQSPQTLLALIGELKEIQKEQPPALQAKIDNIVAKLTILVKQMFPAANTSEDMPVAQQQTSGANSGGENTSPSTAGKIAAKNVNTGANTTVPGGDAGAGAVKSQDLPAVTTQTGQPANADESAAYSEALVTKNNHKSPGGITRPQLEQNLEQACFVPEDEVNTGPAVVNRQNAPESNTANSINKAVEMQQKLLEILRQFSDEINKHEPSGKLREVLRDLTACAKALQINPESEWESLLRYPLIYKQTLNKTLKLLQELINTKNSDDHSLLRNITGLLSEISANLHVQNSVNQLRQENPANQTMYFQIPLQVGNEIKNGEMLVVHQREKRGNKWEIVNSWYRFYLETQYLGPVQINLNAANKQLNIGFVLMDKEQVELFNKHKQNLNQVLTHYGYEVIDITCSSGEVSPLFLLGSDDANHQCVDIMI